MNNQKLTYKNQPWCFYDYDLNSEIRLYESIVKKKHKLETWSFIASSIILSVILYALLGNNSKNLFNNLVGCLSGGTLISLMLNNSIKYILSPITNKLKISKNIKNETTEMIHILAQSFTEQKFQYSLLIYLEELEKLLDKYRFHDDMMEKYSREALGDIRNLQYSLIHYLSHQQYHQAAQLMVTGEGISQVNKMLDLIDKINIQTAIEKSKLQLKSLGKNEMQLKIEAFKNSLNQFKNLQSQTPDIENEEQEFEYKKYL